MADQTKALLELLRRIDGRRQPETDSAIAQRIGTFLENTIDEEIDAEYRAEAMAFDFVPEYKNTHTGWGTYYGPKMVFSNDKGQLIESPSFKSITSAVLAYWSQRAKESAHPIFRVRYADLVWDFSEPAAKEKPPVEMAQLVVDATIAMAKEDLCASANRAFIKLRRALSLALSIKDKARVGQLARVIMNYEARVSRDTHPNLWGHSFDLLLKPKGVALSASQEDQIIEDLERRLARLTAVENDKGLDPFCVDSVCKRLARFYQGLGRQEDLERVLSLYADSYLHASKRQSPLVASGWLQGVFKTLGDFGMRDRADEISHRLKALATASRDEMAVFSQRIKIDHEEMEAFLDELLAGSLEEAYVRLAFEFLPNPDNVEEQLRDLVKAAPLQFMMPTSIKGYGGHTVSQVGPITEDMEGRIVLQISQNMGFEAPFLNLAIEGLLAKYSPTAEEIASFLLESPLFQDSRRPLIERGIAAFLQRDCHAAACMLVPEIETAIRRLLELGRGSIYRRGRGGGLLLRTLDQMLTDPVTTKVLDERGAKYLRVLLTDQRGWNLRNGVCHGLLPPQMFTVGTANRIFHAVLLLGLLRAKQTDEEESKMTRNRSVLRTGLRPAADTQAGSAVKDAAVRSMACLRSLKKMCYRLLHGSPSLYRDFGGQLSDVQTEPGRCRCGPSTDLHVLVGALP